MTCARCRRNAPADQMVYSRFTRNHYCADLTGCARRARRLATKERRHAMPIAHPTPEQQFPANGNPPVLTLVPDPFDCTDTARGILLEALDALAADAQKAKAS